MSEQTLAVGETPTNTIASRLGYSNIRMIPAPDECFAIIQGLPNAGKTTFMQSCPSALIVNLDISSTPGDHTPMASFWPGLYKGRPVRPHPSNDPSKGQPFTLSFQEVLDLIDTLITMAEASDPSRPQVVVFDTLDQLFSLATRWIVDNQVQLGISRPDYQKPTFESFDGRQVYNVLYNKICNDIVDRLRSVGYGVYFNVQLIEKDETDDKGNFIRTKVETGITRTFMSRLYPRAELVLTIAQANQFDRTAGKATKRRVSELITQGKDNTTSNKTRRTLVDKIVLDPKDGWSTFVKAYQEAVNKGDS